MRTEAEATCIWCGCPFSLRVDGGKKQRFCCAAHRSRYWRALRKWASRVFDAGLISIDDLRRAQVKMCVAGAAGPNGGDMPAHSNVHGAQDAGKEA
jgi:hypothetical protein